MQNIGIITICDNTNYGNRLQNYALEKVLFDMNVDVKTIWDKKYAKKTQKAKKIIKGVFFSNKYPSLKRMKNFEEFSKNFTNIYYHGYNEELNDMFDTFIVGSDQVFTKSHLNKVKFLSEAETNKGIAFSPSFGKSYLEDDEKITLPKCNFSSKSLQSMIGCNCFVDINAGTPKLVVGDKVEIILI